MVLACVFLSLAGCNGQKATDPIWKDVKIRDLAPSQRNDQPATMLLRTVNLSVYTFEVPAENIDTLNVISQNLSGYAKRLRFNNHNAFVANSLSVAYGPAPRRAETTNLLQAKAEKIKTTSLLLPDEQPYDFSITRLYDREAIFFNLADGSMQAVDVGSGRIVLRITAKKISGTRGLCKINVLPVFARPIKSFIPALVEQERSKHIPFTVAGFSLKMSPGDFFLFSPLKYSEEESTLTQLLFGRPGPKPAVVVFLFVCTAVTN